jgi:cutinase
MKAAATFFLASLAAAAPSADLDRRQLFGGSTMVANDLHDGPCKEVTFIWVRGTTETANLVSDITLAQLAATQLVSYADWFAQGQYIGSRLVPEIKKKIPNIAVQGVKYGAGIMGNLTPAGGDAQGIAEAVRDYNMAATKCPNTIITGGGYSQGAAITHRAIEKLSESVKARIAAVVLFGDTQRYKDKEQIKGFPVAKTKTYCNGYGELASKSKDGVCNGLLAVNAGHMSYGDSFVPAANWIASKVAAYKASKGA